MRNYCLLNVGSQAVEIINLSRTGLGKFLSWVSHIIPMCIVSVLWSCVDVVMSAMIEEWVKESGQRGCENQHVSVPDFMQCVMCVGFVAVGT